MTPFLTLMTWAVFVAVTFLLVYIAGRYARWREERRALRQMPFARRAHERALQRERRAPRFPGGR